MCKYRKGNKCLVNNGICPWVSWCDKLQTWKLLKNAPKECKLAKSEKIPKGYYAVEFERKGILYIRLNDARIIKLKNIFNYIPQYVKLCKNQNEWKLVEQKENKELWQNQKH